MKTIPIDEQMVQVGERAGREASERFVQEGIDRWHRQREAKERRDEEAETSVDSAKQMTGK